MYQGFLLSLFLLQYRYGHQSGDGFLIGSPLMPIKPLLQAHETVSSDTYAHQPLQKDP
jgi:hypothetical protein